MRDEHILPTAYLDMNIVGLVAEGSLRLPVGEVRYVYSSEHFTEISRGDGAFLLDCLSALGAYEMSVDLDNWQITDTARLHANANIHDRYREHNELMSPGVAHTATFQSIAAMMWGADNVDRVRASIEDLPHTILPNDQLDRNPELVAEASRVAKHLLETLGPATRPRPPLVEQRRALGASRAQTAGLPPEQVIPEIWSRISPQVAGLTMEELFGAKPIDALGYKIWPMFLAAIQCHSMLNTLGYRPDKGMADEDRTANILSDGAHIAHAMYCDLLLTADRRLSAKASVVYAFLRAKTRVGLVTALPPRDRS